MPIHPTLSYAVFEKENKIRTIYVIKKREKVRCSKCNTINMSKKNCWWVTCHNCNHSIKQIVDKPFKKNTLHNFADIVLNYENTQILV